MRWWDFSEEQAPYKDKILIADRNNCDKLNISLVHVDAGSLQSGMEFYRFVYVALSRELLIGILLSERSALIIYSIDYP